MAINCANFYCIIVAFPNKRNAAFSRKRIVAFPRKRSAAKKRTICQELLTGYKDVTFCADGQKELVKCYHFSR